jgi:uroporphyrinogen decarboxylase
MNKREWLLRWLSNETLEKIPLGFWFHFSEDELADGFVDRKIIENNIEGHKKFFNDFQPDMIKIMTDGFFMYPNREFQEAGSAGDLWKVKSIGADHPWIKEQAAYAGTLVDLFGKDIMLFYNIFSPATTFKFVRMGSAEFRARKINPDTLLAHFLIEDKEAALHALNVVAEDIAALAAAVVQAGVDGIYLSAQDLSDPRVDGRLHREALFPGDCRVLEAAKSARGNGGVYNILHICGYAGHSNKFEHFVDYPAEVFNWAAKFEKFPLGKGKKLFKDKPVIGGFDNTADGILYRGSREEIQAETGRILAEAGRKGIVLGADCTLPRDIDLQRLQWVREAVS